MLAGGGEDEIAGGYEAFFVGEAYGFAAEDRGVGGFKTGDAYDGGDDEVGLGERGHADSAGGAVDDFDAGDSGGVEARGELGGEGFGAERDDLRTPTDALGEGCVEIRAGCEGDGMEAVGVRFAEAESALTDGAG